MSLPTTCTPRGRWIYGRYVKAYGSVTSNKSHIYEVVSVGTGLPTDPTDPEYLAPGDLVVINPAHTVQVGTSYALIDFDNGLYAKWNPTFDEPITLYSTIYCEANAYQDDQGVGWLGDLMQCNVLAVDPAITDIAVNDTIMVPKRYAVQVGYRVNTRFLVRAEHVVAKC